MAAAPVVPPVAAARLPPGTLAQNFADLHPPLSANEARVASERCLFCYDAPCVAACPTGIDVPLFIRQISTGNALPAAKTILEANILGGMCARVCPTETLCEQACVRMASEGKPVQIGLLQRHATDALLATGSQIFARAPVTERKVAVVGAGPAGLACAHALARLGHAVTIFDAREKPGGLNEYGIAAYKTVDDFAAREVEYILGIGGIELRLGHGLGRGLTLAALRASHDAVFLGLGLAATNTLGLSHSGLSGIEDAVDYIARLRQTPDKSKLPIGRRVIVIGGGMTAIDMATQARRLGAEDVTIAYRRDASAMKASRFEQELAQKAGVLIRHWLRPVALHGEAGVLQSVDLAYMHDDRGRLTDTGESLTLPCDQLYLAIGQAYVPFEAEAGLALEQGRIRVDGLRRTSLPGVWAGGDCIHGGKDLTVSAVEDGKQAAASIHSALGASLQGARQHG